MFGRRPTDGSTPSVDRLSAVAASAAARKPEPAEEASVAAPAASSAAPAAQGASKPAAKPVSKSAPKSTGKSAAKPTTDPATEEGQPRTEEYYEIKTAIFNALIDTIDLGQLAQLDNEAAAEEIRDIVTEIISIKNLVMSIAEQEQLLRDICNDVLGYGPLEPLLARDEISDIMVNGASAVFIEVDGKVQKTSVRFRDNAQLMNICQRIVSQVGRRVDESSPICDARLADGSRVNVIAPPLALDGPTLTIRKFKKDKLTMKIGRASCRERV